MCDLIADVHPSDTINEAREARSLQSGPKLMGDWNKGLHSIHGRELGVLLQLSQGVLCHGQWRCQQKTSMDFVSTFMRF
jgi:hypothetical protein